LGKRFNYAQSSIKQGGKNIPRLGRRSFTPSIVDELKYYSHVQPFDSKFVLDVLSDELFVGDGDLKFVSWNDFDKALESDTELYSKLTSIARDKEIEELKKLMSNQASSDYDNEVVGRPHGDATKYYQQFVPYEGKNKYNNRENEVYYYNNEVKRDTAKANQ